MLLRMPRQSDDQENKTIKMFSCFNQNYRLLGLVIGKSQTVRIGGEFPPEKQLKSGLISDLTWPRKCYGVVCQTMAKIFLFTNGS